MNRRGFIRALGAAVAVAASLRLSSIPELEKATFEIDSTNHGFGMVQIRREGEMLRYDGEDTFGVYMELGFGRPF